VLREGWWVDEAEAADLTRAPTAEARAMDERLHARARRLDPRGATCVLVDDGLATGATMIAACRWARARGAARVVAAVPVGARQSLADVRAEADEVVCPNAVDDLVAVGLWYRRFGPTGEDEVLYLLGAGGAARAFRPVRVPTGPAEVDGDLALPPEPRGVVVFAHGSGSSRRSPRNRQVAERLQAEGLGTLLLDLLTPREEERDLIDARHRFDIGLLARRLVDAIDWSGAQPDLARLPLGLFGASTGAAAALVAAAERPARVAAVVSRGGRPDLAGEALRRVTAPVLLIVGGDDRPVIPLNRAAREWLPGPSELRLVPGATHLFEEPGALDQVAAMAGEWFVRHLAGRSVEALQ
jgi:putative phosphoribosyl transferase